MLEASNLGQIIGRLEYGALEPRRCEGVPTSDRQLRRVVGRDTADEAEPRPPRPPRTVLAETTTFARGPMAKIREVLAKHPEGLRFGPLRELTALDKHVIATTLGRMADIERSGGRRHYLYKLVATGAA